MNSKKWPIMAQILIGWGCCGGLLDIIGGLCRQEKIGVILGIVNLIIFWKVYRFKKWALIGLTIVLTLKIIFSGISLFYGFPIIFGGIVITINVLMIIYFNSKKIKSFFSVDS